MTVSILCKPHGNTKAKTYRIYTKGKGKRIKAYHYRKSSKVKETKHTTTENHQIQKKKKKYRKKGTMQK